MTRALQARWLSRSRTPLIAWSLDAVISQLPFDLTGSASAGKQGFPLTTDSVGSRVDVGSLGHKLNQLSAKHVRQLALHELDVVVDYVLLNEALLVPFELELSEFPVLFVGLYCDEQVLATRNIARVDRASDLAVSQQRRVHFRKECYDLRLDSSNSSPDELAASVLAYLDGNNIGRGFSSASSGGCS